MRDFISTSPHVLKIGQFNNGHILAAKTEALKSNSLPKSFFSPHYCARRIHMFKNSVNKHIQGSIKRLRSYTGMVVKPANRYIRWNLAFTFLVFFFITSSVWIPIIPVINDFALETVTIVSIVLHLLWFTAVFNALRYAWYLRRHRYHKIDLSKVNNPTNVMVKHLVGICIYKEPLQLVMDTVDSISCQPNAKLKITCLVAMEEGTPDKEEKRWLLHKKYDEKFERFIVTFHPKGLPGDIPGKCSNFNYGSRQAVKQLRLDKDYPLDSASDKVELLVTTGDCDSIFGERYFDSLEEDYWKLKPEQRQYTVWQSPLFYCINPHKSPFFVRITGFLRAFFMMGYLIPWNINTMSIFSLTLKLFEDGEYTHPGYQVRFMIASTMIAYGLQEFSKRRNYIDEWYEWARQIRRWTIGAAEVFHYFVIKFFRLPLTVSLSFAAKFIFYYGFLLCVASVYSIVAPLLTPIVLNAVNHGVKGLLIPSQSEFTWIMLGSLGLQYFWFFCVFLVIYLCEPVFPAGTKDRTGILRNIFHFLMTWPTITMYCLVEMAAFLEVTVRGKSVCSHNASKKDNLVAEAPDMTPDRMEV